MGCSCSNPSHQEDATRPRFFLCQDFKELPGQTSNAGIKKTIAWSGRITTSQLQEKREEFWRNRRSGNRLIWRCIRQAVEADAESGALILQMNEITLEKDNLTTCFDSDEVRYEIPVWVINDPVKFADIDIQSEATRAAKKPEKPVVKGEALTIKLRSMLRQTDILVELVNTDSTQKLVDKFCEEFKEIKPANVRIFFGGKELREEASLLSYNIQNEMVVQVYVKKE